MFGCFRGIKKDETALMRNGRMLLEESIAFNNGKGNPIRCFSVQDVINATNNCDEKQIFVNEGLYKLYEGSLQDRPVIVKIYKENESYLQESVRDIVYGSQMSVHKNVLKLLGCCLESKVPILVFEHAKNRSLDEYIYKNTDRPNFQALLWKNRLKIAVDVANVIAYLHTAFSRPIVHRDIKISNIMLDEDYVAKLSDFSLSMSIPEGETHIEDSVKGTFGYLDIEYLKSSKFNEKIDVYSFGITLLQLLTGKRSIDGSNPINPNLSMYVKEYVEKNHRFDELVDPKIVEEGSWQGKEQQLEAFGMLALQCIRDRGVDRPDITDVAKQLRQIYESLITNHY